MRTGIYLHIQNYYDNYCCHGGKTNEHYFLADLTTIQSQLSSSFPPFFPWGVLFCRGWMDPVALYPPMCLLFLLSVVLSVYGSDIAGTGDQPHYSRNMSVAGLHTLLSLGVRLS